MHAKRHVSKKKEFIEVAAGGHGPLYAAYELLPCAPQLFRAMLDAESLAVLLDESGHCKRKAAKAGLVESLPALPKAMFSRKPL